MKKILLFTDSLGAGGAQRQLVGLAIFLQQAGYDVKVCTYYNFSFYKSMLDDNQVPNELISNAANKTMRIIAVGKYIKRERPDWVIAFQETPSIIACIVKLFYDKFKLLVSERNTTQCIGRNERIRFKLFKLANCIVPNSYSQADFINNNFPHLQSKVVVIPNFVDLDYFKPVLHLRDNIIKILIVASLWQSKNALNLIDALKILKDKGFLFHVNWYGKNIEHIKYFNRCQSKIEEYGLGKYIDIFEKTKQIREVYQNSDVFCLPSFYEGTPNVICEALACGLPVVCSEVCDNPMYVKEGINGFLFDPHSVEDIALNLEKIIEIKNVDYISYCQQSRKIAEEQLSKDVFIERYLALIKS